MARTHIIRIIRMGVRVGLNAIGSVLGDAGKIDFEPESRVSDEGIKVAVPGILNLGLLRTPHERSEGASEEYGSVDGSRMSRSFEPSA